VTDALTLQKQLLSVVSIAGFEEQRACLIATMVAPLCDNVMIDRMYNVIAHKKGEGARVMMSAHMDSIGFLVTYIEECGFIRFDCLGGVPAFATIDCLVRFENGIVGRIGRVQDDAKPNPLLSYITPRDLYIDIGAVNGEQARSMVSVGDIAHYEGQTELLGSDTILSPYFDDLIACVVLIQTLEKLEHITCPNDLYFVFSTQEEIGCRGAKAATYSIDPQFGIALDVTPTGDMRESLRYMEVSLGGGAAIKIKDGSVICTPSIVERLKRTAQEKGIPYQLEILEGGGTDTGEIQHNRNGAAAGCISIPSRYVHHPYEMVRQSDVAACVDLLCAVLAQDLAGGVL